MIYVKPIEVELEVIEDGEAYSIVYYEPPSSMSGVTDETHPEFDTGTTYDVGEYCKIDGLKSIYKSSDTDNIGNYPPAEPTKWTRTSPLNSYKMLAVDESIGAQTTGTDVVMTFDFSARNAFALLHIDFDSVVVTITDTSTGLIEWTKEYTGTNAGVTSYYEYFYLDFTSVSNIMEGDLPWLSSATITFTFTGAMKVGSIVSGVMQDMSCTLYGSSLKFEDTSTINKSDVTGFRSVVRYGSIKVLSVDVLLETGRFNETAQAVREIIGRNILFVPTTDDRFSETITIGYFESFEMPMLEDNHFQSKAVIIGLI